MKSSSAIRAGLDFPIIDIDGHTIEFEPAVSDYLKETGGRKLLVQFEAWRRTCLRWYELSLEERRRQRPTRISWWSLPTKNTLDRATATLPRLRYERMDELGLDFTILYPSLGLLLPHIENEELRRAACRAFNRLNADLHSDYRYRMTHAAIIPTHTPQEAIAELEYSSDCLGMKVAMCASYIRRTVQANSKISGTHYWLDTYGIDSLYDYDPVWSKCAELKMVPTFHSTGMGWGSRTSISSFMYNHIGSFAAAAEPVCKSLFLGGVTRRFPKLRFVFLEGGVGWACSLYSDLAGHWHKRNRKVLENYDPKNLDVEQLLDLCRRYGSGPIKGAAERQITGVSILGGLFEAPDMLDEWQQCRIKRAEDIRNLFASKFFFGCEGDDPLNAWATNIKVNPFDTKLKVLFGSDMGHWDVPDMTKVVADAYGMVKKGILTEPAFRDFVFANPVSCYAGLNPAFFKGTAVEKEAAEELTRARPEGQ
ncbi:MAG: hypothetical protein OJF52_004420 [Nitrospira sp.]|nr:MAG: hypothetical protein OJF52_004420 [Nitrospira sp.]